MDIHPERNIVATGQMAEKGRAKMIDWYVWDSDDWSIIQKLTGFHLRAINVIKFSPSGQYLVSVGEDDYHSCAVYEWKTGRLVGTSKVGGDKMLTAAWKNDKEFMVAGVKEIKFFTLNGSKLESDKGLFGKTGNIPICSSTFTFKDQLATGTSKGKLLIWTGRKVSKAVQLSKDSGQMWALCSTKSNLIVGDSTGTVYFLDSKFEQKRKIVVNTQFNPQIRAIDYLEDSDMLLVGTRGAEIYEYVKSDKGKWLMRGHFDGEVWGAAAHPSETLFVTWGGDKTIRVWDTRKMVAASEPFESDIKSWDWSSNGKWIWVGGANGKAFNVDAKTLAVLGEVTSILAKKSDHWWIEDIKFAPDNTQFVFGTHGGLSKIEFVKVEDNGKISKGKVVDVGMSSALTHLDWSSDSEYVVVNSQGYELFWVNTSSYERVTASSAKDIDWYTWTWVLGFPVIGIWPGVDMTDVNACWRSFNRRILATGEDSSKVKLFKYPWYVEKAKFKEYYGHSSHLTEVKFTVGDNYLVTVGGNDKTVIVWSTDFGKDTGEDDEEDKDPEIYQDDDGEIDIAKGDFDDSDNDIGAVKQK